MIETKKQKFGKHYFLHTYSTEGLKIMQEQTGIVYDDAWDKLDSEFTYSETDEPIEGDPDAS